MARKVFVLATVIIGLTLFHEIIGVCVNRVCIPMESATLSTAWFVDHKSELRNLQRFTNALALLADSQLEIAFIANIVLQLVVALLAVIDI